MAGASTVGVRALPPGTASVAPTVLAPAIYILLGPIGGTDLNCVCVVFVLFLVLLFAYFSGPGGVFGIGPSGI